ncbi:UNVERIFIED_CONTAM: hypothetical protein B566_EDAN019387 [Ephemera danica]|nr:hypothetical protein B566_EDAN019387 [Ephemera danica]
MHHHPKNQERALNLSIPSLSCAHLRTILPPEPKDFDFSYGADWTYIPADPESLAISCHWLPELGLANFLPCCRTVVVVAVSQAPSPESNPNSPLPVTAMVVQYTTIES